MFFDHFYLVRLSFPVYHHSTDGYIGQRSIIHETFSTYEEASLYLAENFNSHEDCGDIEAYITAEVTLSDGSGALFRREYTMRELVPNSYYTGPVDLEDPSIPF